MKLLIGYMMTVLLLAVGAFFAPPLVNQASSQLTIQLGGDFGNAKRNLIANGYTQIRLVGQGFTKFQVEACQNGIRYWFKADGRGRVNDKRRIGNCRSQVSIEQVQSILASQGYSRINVEDHGGTYLAVACLGDQRLRIKIDHLGQIGNRRILGTCRRSLSPADVTAVLKKEGYTRIKFTNRRLPVYRANACLGKRKFNLELNQFAETLSQKGIGNCHGPIDPRNLKSILVKRGYSRVVIIDDRLPRYVAEVCRDHERQELTLHRYGDIIDKLPTGSCVRRIDRRQIVEGMREQGFNRIDIKRDDNNGYMVEACHTRRIYRVEFNPYGGLLGERVLGACQPYSIKQVEDQLANRDYRDLQFYVQGCRRGKIIRFSINEFGDRSNRKVLGNCN